MGAGGAMSSSRSAGSRFRRRFVSGLLVVVPLVVTYLVLRFLFEAVDGILAPVVTAVFKRPIPGVGILVTFLIVMVAGWITAGVAGGKLIKMWENWLVRLPVIRIVYGAAKQFLEAVSQRQEGRFQQVGLVEYPRKGLYTVCFLANRLPLRLVKGSEERISVFVPSTPTPFTGFVILVPADEIIPLNLPLEDAIKLLVSGGIVVPPLLSEDREIRN